MVWSLLLILSVTPTPVDSNIHIRLGSCAYQDTTQRIRNGVSGRKPDLFVHLGDAVYADMRDTLVMRAAYNKASQNGRFRSIRESTPFLST